MKFAKGLTRRWTRCLKRTLNRRSGRNRPDAAIYCAATLWKSKNEPSNDWDNTYCMKASGKNRNCPNCKEGNVTALMLFRSVTGIGPNPRCRSCLERLSVGATWQGNFVGSLLLSSFLAVACSIAERSYVPFLILPGSLALAIFVVWRHATMKVVLPMAAWLQAAHYLVLVLFLILLVYFFR
jgi:hypothetical protein